MGSDNQGVAVVLPYIVNSVTTYPKFLCPREIQPRSYCHLGLKILFSEQHSQN